jgi:hypothetical protein
MDRSDERARLAIVLQRIAPDLAAPLWRVRNLRELRVAWREEVANVLGCEEASHGLDESTFGVLPCGATPTRHRGKLVGSMAPPIGFTASGMVHGRSWARTSVLAGQSKWMSSKGPKGTGMVSGDVAA